MAGNYTPPPGIYSRILRKVRRALRNDTGIALSADEVAAFVHSDVYPLLAEAERQELLSLYSLRQEIEDERD